MARRWMRAVLLETPFQGTPAGPLARRWAKENSVGSVLRRKVAITAGSLARGLWWYAVSAEGFAGPSEGDGAFGFYTQCGELLKVLLGAVVHVDDRGLNICACGVGVPGEDNIIIWADGALGEIEGKRGWAGNSQRGGDGLAEEGPEVVAFNFEAHLGEEFFDSLDGAGIALSAGDVGFLGEQQVGDAQAQGIDFADELGCDGGCGARCGAR